MPGYRYMNRRTEPRFQVYALARIALFDHPESESSGELVDVSGAGLRVLASEVFEPNQIITVETDQHLILAEVRNCTANGSKFSIGAERVHSVAKLSLPRTASRGERNQVLVEDFHRRLHAELDSPPELAAVRSTAAAARFSSAHPQLAPSADSSAPDLTLMTEVAEVLPAPEAPPPPNEEAPVPMAVVTAPSPAVVEPSPAYQTGALATAKEPESKPAMKPEEPLREMFRQPANSVSKANARSRILAVLIAAALTVVAIVGLSFGPFARRAPLQTSVAAKSTSAPAASLATEPAPAPAKAPAPLIPAPVGKPQPSPKPGTAVTAHASITSSDRSWITACADGKPSFSKLFVEGSKDDLAFSQRALVRMGSAGPVEIILNGKPVGPLGRTGQVVIVELTPAGFRIAMPGEPGDCTK